MAGKKLPPAPGCVDEQLSSLVASTATPSEVHAELDIRTTDTPYALQLLMDMYRTQFMQMLESMRSPQFKTDVNEDIKKEKVSN